MFVIKIERTKLKIFIGTISNFVIVFVTNFTIKLVRKFTIDVFVNFFIEIFTFFKDLTFLALSFSSFSKN